MRWWTGALLAIVLAGAVALVGCGRKLGPIADSLEDVHRLPPDTRKVRVRGLGEDGVAALPRLRGLHELSLLSGWKAYDVQAPMSAYYALSPDELPRLRHIRVGASASVDGRTLEWIGSFPSLRSVVIAGCDNPSGQDLRALRDLERLTYLRLGPKCPWLDEQAFVELAEFAAEELELELGGNPGLDPAWIERLAEAKPKWKILRSRADGLTVWRTE